MGRDVLVALHRRLPGPPLDHSIRMALEAGPEALDVRQGDPDAGSPLDPARDEGREGGEVLDHRVQVERRRQRRLKG